ncbi:MAG TPA: hypothetical protein VF941_11935 [Clostridia bacterium]
MKKKRSPNDILTDIKNMNDYTSQQRSKELHEELEEALKHEPLNEYGKWYWGI